MESNNLYDIATAHLGADIFKGANLVDVGCMRFAVSKILRDKGARVTAIDRCDREAPPEGIPFIHTDFLDWHPTEPVDILYLSNVTQFIPTDKVFAKIDEVGAPTIIVRTMYAYPEPNWGPDELQKMYFTVAEDWATHFEGRGYETKFSRQYEYDGQDFKGRDRKFRFIDYLATKKR